MQYLKNIKIYQDTKNEFHKGQYRNAPHVEGIPYKGLKTGNNTKKWPSTRVEIVNEDTLAGCQNLKEEGLNPAGLIFANQDYPGGGVDRGCLAQEENVFRRSNCHRIMPEKFYRLDSKGGLYLPQVIVIKDKNYELLPKTHTTAMIVSAAICDPKLDEKGHYANVEDRELMEENIRQIFQVGYENGHDALVLGAYGLGAFNNSVEDIIAIFNQMISEYRGCFKVIRFSIINLGTKNFEHFENHLITQPQ
jgi:uncharacterized protein (TIGR02452 family)